MNVFMGMLGIGSGLVFIFAKDFAWELTNHFNKTRGIVDAQRTPEWEDGATMAGVILIIFGVFALLAT